MNIRMEKAGPCRRELHIEVPAERVRDLFAEVLASYARVARIPGFRPGRAPQELIRRRYQKEISGDVRDRLIPEGYQAAVKQERLSTVAVLDVREQSLEENQPFSFSILVDVAPEFTLPTYTGIPLTRKLAVVEESDVDVALKKIREHHALYEDVEGRPVQLGDLVNIDYEGVCEGRPIEELAPGAKELGNGTDFWLMADKENEFLPGFAQGLAGAAVGERREVVIDFPADFAESALAGRKAFYFVHVKALREKKLPELDGEFLKGIGVSSIEELRERVRGDLKNLRERNESRRLQNEIISYLLGATNLDLPESILQEETRQEVYELVRHNQRRGVSADEIEEHKEELFDSATRSATEKVKLRYILRRIAAEQKITVDEADVDARVRALAAGWGVAPDRLRADLEKRNALSQLRDELVAEKVLAALMEMAAITDEGNSTA